MELSELFTLLATLLLSGWVAAFITQLIKQSPWASSVKLVLSVVVAGLVGLATAWVTGDVTKFLDLWPNMKADDILTFGVLVYTVSATWYRFYFKDATWAQNLGWWPKKPEG